MKTFPRLAILGVALTLVGWMPLQAQQPTPDQPSKIMTLNVAGQERHFEVAFDELFFPANRELKKFSTQKNFSDLLELASELLMSTKEEVELVLYTAGSRGTDGSRHILTNRVLVESDSPGVAVAIGEVEGVSSVSQASFAENFYLVEVAKPGTSPEVAERLREREDVQAADAEITRALVLDAVPNDPLSSFQWHIRPGLVEEANPEINLNVLSAWDTYRGNGILISIIDNGVEVSHPDLVANNFPSLNFNALTGTPNGTPVFFDDNHGTAVAGIAAGVGFNGIGTTGVAPGAQFNSVYLIPPDGLVAPSQSAAALGHGSNQIDISSNSWGPEGGFYTPLSSVELTAIENATMTGRGGLGVVYLFSAGNGGEFGENSNSNGYANSIYTIAVGAIGPDAAPAPYSEPGANVVISAPSSIDGGGELGYPDDSAGPMIATTDRTGKDQGYNQTPGEFGFLANPDYTNNFGGTSASCPMVSGVVALMLEANPSLTWREVQEILIQTAAVTESMISSGGEGAEFITNAAGLTFSHLYGSGLADAEAATTVAAVFPGMEARLISEHAPNDELPLDIPDEPATRVISFDVETDIQRVEHVVLEMSLDHTWIGDVGAQLVSPEGTTSILSEFNNDFRDSLANFPFMTVRNWGENPNGTWLLILSDLFPLVDEGDVTALNLRLYGTQSDIDPVAEGLDKEPPQVTIFSGSSGGTSLHMHPVTGEATDDIGVKRVEYRANGTEWRRANMLLDGRRWWFMVGTLSGSQTAEVRAIDRANKVSQTKTVTVK